MTKRYFCGDPVPGHDRNCFRPVLVPEKIEMCLLVVCITIYFTVNRIDPVTGSFMAETARIWSPFGRLFVVSVAEKRLAEEPLTADAAAVIPGCLKSVLPAGITRIWNFDPAGRFVVPEITRFSPAATSPGGLMKRQGTDESLPAPSFPGRMLKSADPVNAAGSASIPATRSSALETMTI
jgi:hypothetical protein